MGYVDIHSHILPQVDDGASDMETTIEMLRIAKKEGITHLIATPHYRSGRYPADCKKHQEILEKVQQQAQEQGISIQLYLGNEIFYRSGLEEKFQRGQLSTMNHSAHVLVEFSPLESFVYIRNAMDDIWGMGYIPIIAHIERYQCVCKKPEYVKELKSMGCEIQVNAASITGESGFLCKRFVHKLIKQQLVDYVGTDAHNTTGRRPALKKCAALLYKKYESSYVDDILFKNAEEILIKKIN